MAPLRTLRSRLVASYILVVVLGLLAAAVALFFLLQGYRDRLALLRLADVSVPVAVQVRTMARQGANPDDMVAALRDQADEVQVRVILLDRQGRVLQDTTTEGSLRGRAFEVDLPPLGGPQRLWGGRYNSPSGPSLLYTVLPVAALLPTPRPPDAGGLAYVVVAQPETIGPALAELAPVLLIAAGVAVLAAVLIGLLVTRSLYRPIRRLTAASEQMSRGDYGQRVPVQGAEELVDLALSFNRMASETQRSRQVLRDFVANVSHELKTPLTAIRGFVQALRDGTATDEEERARALGIIDGEARRLQGLVAQLLDLSRMEAGQVAMQRQPVLLVDLVRRCLDIFSLRAEGQDVRLAADVPADLAVVGDADRLEQLLNNLLDNALKHSASGQEITVKGGVASGGHATLAVIDAGSGIPAAELPFVFERFYSSRGSAGGTGLGLAIAREIARAHGGDISATSAPNVATTFIITLPLWREGASATPSSYPSQTQAGVGLESFPSHGGLTTTDARR